MQARSPTTKPIPHSAVEVRGDAMKIHPTSPTTNHIRDNTTCPVTDTAEACDNLSRDVSSYTGLHKRFSRHKRHLIAA